MQKTRAIASARAFLGYSGFDLLVDIVGLEPIDTWRTWRDFEGNTLVIHKTKSVRVHRSKIPSKKTIDIFRKSNPLNIAKHSYWVLCLFGNPKSILCFLGYDGKLRCCQFNGAEWIGNTSPILLGYDVLRCVISGYIETDARKISIPIITYPKDFDIEEAWESGYPSNDAFVQDKLYKLLKVGNK